MQAWAREEWCARADGANAPGTYQKWRAGCIGCACAPPATAARVDRGGGRAARALHRCPACPIAGAQPPPPAHSAPVRTRAWQPTAAAAATDTAQVTITKESTTIVGDGSTQQEVKARVAQIRNLAAATEQDYEKEKLNERIARLSGGVAIIQVRAVAGLRAGLRAGW